MATPTEQRCSYLDNCRIRPGGPQPSLERCGAQGCSNFLHHLCRAEYEAAHTELDPGELNKRCLPCLAKPSKQPAPQHAPTAGGLQPTRRSPRVAASSQRLSQSRLSLGGPNSTAAASSPPPVRSSPRLASRQQSAAAASQAAAGSSLLATNDSTARQLDLSANDSAASEAASDDELHASDAEQQPRRRGRQPRQRVAPGQKRTSLTVDQQVELLKHVESFAVGDRPSFVNIAMWAKETFTLKAPPSKGYISKLLKAKSTLLSTHSSLSSKNASRKRKRFA
mmetsp:Transcript_8227/g.21104  ORF Transcript_8227/g.21104 Transcript_8227/m.21104 type:complete len:281 (+) Transcript_8227:153-995(+)